MGRTKLLHLHSNPTVDPTDRYQTLLCTSCSCLCETVSKTFNILLLSIRPWDHLIKSFMQ